MKGQYKILIVIFFLSFFVRLFTALYYLNFDKHVQELGNKPFLYGSYTTPEIIGDRDAYNSMARNIAFLGNIGRGEEFLVHPPLYPFFLAIFYFLFGYNIYSFLIPQIILDAANSILVFFLAQRLFNNSKVSLSSSLFYAFNPHFILLSIQLYSETLYFFLLLSIILSLQKLISKLNLNNAFFAGVLMGLAALCRSVFLVFIPFIFAYLINIYLQEKKKLLIVACAIFLPFSLVCSSWLIRNYKIYNRIIFSTDFKLVLAAGMSEKNGEPTTYLKKHKEEVTAFINWVKERPLQYFQYCMDRLKRLLFKSYPPGVSLRHMIVSSIIFYTVFPLGYAMMIIEVIKKRNSAAWLIFLYILSTTIVYILTDIDGELRYRLPTELFLGIFACYGFSVPRFRLTFPLNCVKNEALWVKARDFLKML